MDKPIQNIKQNPLVSIIILNWNGYKDTIDCLTSLSKCINENFEVILVDNGSTDGSAVILSKWIEDKINGQGERKFKLITDDSIISDIEKFIPVFLIENKENFGFARGNNIGITMALKHNASYVLLLNNDTVVTDDFLGILLNFFEAHAEYSAATPQIRYFDKPDIIWNCGGAISNFGSRKYYYNDKPIISLPAIDFLDISFVTGCALIMKSDLVRKIGLLTEAFFFGEEDIEFSLRMKRNNIRTACVMKSLIFHKVNSSISRTSEIVIGKIYIHYLGRFIDLKNYMSSWKWLVWRFIYQFYIFYLMKFRHKIPYRVIRKFLKLLMENSSALNGVSKALFDKYVNFDFS